MVGEPGGTAPAFRRRYGGFWIDREDAEDVLAAKRERGELDAEDAARLASFMADGYLVLPKAVDDAVIDRLAADVETAWGGGDARIHVEHYADGQMFIDPIRPEFRDQQTKLLDFYAHSAAAREAVFAAPTLRFLRLLFPAEPLAFQCLYFQRGTQQYMHQDTAFVGVGRPNEFVGSWLALEDVREGTGELEYYRGSHRIEEFLFAGRDLKMPNGSPEEQEYLDSLHRKAAALSLPREKFRAKRGDVIIWHAALVHGGSWEMEAGSTRKSLVTHFCPLDNEPDYARKYPIKGPVHHESGASYCYPVRGARTAVGRALVKLAVLGKTAANKVSPVRREPPG